MWCMSKGGFPARRKCLCLARQQLCVMRAREVMQTPHVSHPIHPVFLFGFSVRGSRPYLKDEPCSDIRVEAVIEVRRGQPKTESDYSRESCSSRYSRMRDHERHCRANGCGWLRTPSPTMEAVRALVKRKAPLALQTPAHLLRERPCRLYPDAETGVCLRATQ